MMEGDSKIESLELKLIMRKIISISTNGKVLITKGKVLLLD
ncbi:MAG: hypothetical protein DAHOPDDO_00842 [Ignavibacteriaceae bacterium]|nr:hypothetical protein [Ignavibacteriaceae bacterium]